MRLELDHLLIEHSVDIRLVNETHLRPGEAFGFAGFVCNCRDRIAEGHGTAILVCRYVDHYACQSRV
jgi:hypothetical protein